MNESPTVPARADALDAAIWRRESGRLRQLLGEKNQLIRELKARVTALEADRERFRTAPSELEYELF